MIAILVVALSLLFLPPLSYVHPKLASNIFVSTIIILPTLLIIFYVWYKITLAKGLRDLYVKKGEEVKAQDIKIVSKSKYYIIFTIVAVGVMISGQFYFSGLARINCYVLSIAYLIALWFAYKNRQKRVDRIAGLDPKILKKKNQASFVALLIIVVIFEYLFYRSVPIIFSMAISLVVGAIAWVVLYKFKK